MNKSKYGGVLLVFVCMPGFAQAPPAVTERPKIGLALEGGGAKGLAHIGVLEWLEEHHIPVDYVAGTSMGALIGGLYATGMRPMEIRKLTERMDWNGFLAGETAYQDLAYRRKEDRRAYPNSMVIGLKQGVLLASGMNSGSRVVTELDHLTLPYSRLSNFDDLPIPFRCVGTDLVSGRRRVFGSGTLGEALRSSMSIPAVFSPVRNDGEVIADGGLLDNLPVDVVKAMGADIIIAVHLDTARVQPKDVRSLLEVAGRSIDVMIDANELANMEAADVLLRVDVSGYATLDFSQVEKIFPKGYEAAQAKSAVLKRFAVSESDWQQYLANLEARRQKPGVTPGFIQVEGVNPSVSHEIQKSLVGLLGRPLTYSKLEGILTRLTGNGRIDSAGYSIIKRGNEEGLLIKATETDYAPPAVYPGFEVDGSDLKDVRFTLGGRLSMLDVGGYRSEVRVDASAGGEYKLGVEYFHPFTSGSRWFVAPHAYVSNTGFNLFSRADLIADYRLNRAVSGLDFGYEIGRSSEVRLGYDVGYFSADRQVGGPTLGSLRGRTGATSLRYTLDRLDSPVIPRSGVGIWNTVQWVNANPGTLNRYPMAETEIQLFHPITKPASVFLQADGGTIFNYRQTGFPEFSLGGPLRLAAYGVNELLTNQYFYFKAGYIHELVKLPAFVGKATYFTSAYEIGKVYGREPSRLPNDVVVGVDVVTALGPAFVGASWGDSGHRKVFFQLGRVF